MRTGEKQIEEKHCVTDWIRVDAGLLKLNVCMRKLQYISPSRRCKAFFLRVIIFLGVVFTAAHFNN